MDVLPSTTLDDPSYRVPTVPSVRDDAGGVAWLRAHVPRFCDGAEHARRRALVEEALRPLDSIAPVATPTAALLAGLGLPLTLASDIAAVAAAYQPHAPQSAAADRACDRLVAACGGRTEEAAARACVLVQAHAATSAWLAEPAAPPVPATRRIAPDGRQVAVDLADAWFGRGPHRCPAEALARRLVAEGRFDALVAEAAAADVTGWGFDWLAGRATEQRPSWGYRRLISDRLARVASALDLDTGGGEMLAGVPQFPPTMAATESWPPNAALATRRLHLRGVVVVATSGDDRALPFAEDAFDLVTSRHPAGVRWTEIARVLRPGGSYLAQHVGGRSNAELYEHFVGPDEPGPHSRDAELEAADAAAAGLEVLDLRSERLRVEFRDIGAVVWFLRKVIWTVPGFDVERHGEQLRELHRIIERDGVFVTHSARTLIEARKPRRPTARSGSRTVTSSTHGGP